MFKVIASGSTGNAVIYHNSILVDCGVPAALLKPYLYSIQIVLLTHEHKDHLNIKTLDYLCKNRPTLRVGCCEWMLKKLDGIKNIDCFTIGAIYDYGMFKISPIKLYHDVQNCGYRIFKGKTKILHATDTAHLNGIDAKNYDVYAIEHNYNEDTINELIGEKESKGGFSYEKSAINRHLSEQQARNFIFLNHGEKYKVLRLHESKK